MRLLYPYNEILPTRRAHDLFVVHECAALAEKDWEVTLLSGRRLHKSAIERQSLCSYYEIDPSLPLHFSFLPLIRKAGWGLRLSYNRPFFSKCQHFLEKMQPDCLLMSVRKQAAFHLKRKLPKIRYVYEVHELAYYPSAAFSLEPGAASLFEMERDFLAKADLVTVTTEALQEILRTDPYRLTVPISVVPLAVGATPLPPPLTSSERCRLMYVGQLYQGQGLEQLLMALSLCKQTSPSIELHILGGTSEEILRLKTQAKQLQIVEQLVFRGFVPPSQLREYVQQADGFVAPFNNRGRMPYVAHTKLFEYAAWGRPFIAPRLPIVQEHFREGEGVILFTPDDPEALAAALATLAHPPTRLQLQTHILTLQGRFNWSARAQRYTHLLKTC